MIAAQFAYFDARISLYARQLFTTEELYAFVDHLYDENREGGFQSSEPLQYTGELDQSNVTVLLSELAVLIRPLSGAARELLNYWAHRFELGNLKTIIRGKMANQPRSAIERQLQDMGAFTSLPVDELLRSDTPAELLRRLEQTPYAEIASRARHLLEEGEALFALDAALDRRYFAGLARRAARSTAARRQPCATSSAAWSTV